MAEKTVKKGTKSAKNQGSSTGLKKFIGLKAKMYDEPKKGSGKPKYQNTIKIARVDTKADSIGSISSLKRSAGKKVTKSEARESKRKEPNTPKQIDREEKIRKGVRTAKPATPKVPVKPRGGRGMGGAVLGSGSRGPVIK